MDAVRDYFLSVTAAALICGVLSSILDGKGAAGKIVKLICGLFLAFTVIRPVADIEIEDFALFTSDISQEAQAAVSAGEEFVQDSLASIIKEETEAYILDKAQALDAVLEAEVTVSSDPQPVPIGVRIKGNVSTYIKFQLQSIIEADLGIAKENQLWIG